MPKQVLRPKNLSFQPRPTYPYSPGAKAGGFVYTAGQVAWDDKGKLVGIGDVTISTAATIDAAEVARGVPQPNQIKELLIAQRQQSA